MDHPATSAELAAQIHEVSLDMDAEAMRQAGYQVVDWIVSRLASIRDSSLGAEKTREETENLLREPLPEQPSSFERVFEVYRNKVAPNAVQLDHPSFFAFIPSAPNYVSILADALMAGTNVFAGTWLESSGPSQVELVVADWFKEMLGLPASAAGLLVSGGSVANLTALAVARRVMLGDRTENAVVYLSSQTHTSVDRALRILGIPAAQLRRIPVDTDFRIDLSRLEDALRADRQAGHRPLAVIANAGTTNTGAVDPLAETAALAQKYSAWFHVDAAYGGFAALTERGRKLLSGIERADSAVLDPHKWFYCPFEAGCVLVREGRQMRETFRILPEYMIDVAREEREVNFCDYGLQLTRAFRALKVWMAVKTYGAQRFRQVIDQCLDLAEYAAALFRESPRFEILTPPSLGIFTFRYVPAWIPAAGSEREDLLNRLNRRLMGRILASRKLMLSSTQLGTSYVLRFCVLNHRTRKDDIVRARHLIEELGEQAERETS